jgi:hypothetical protein
MGRSSSSSTTPKSDPDTTASVKTYRRVFDPLPPAVGFARILIVSGTRTVEALTD